MVSVDSASSGEPEISLRTRCVVERLVQCFQSHRHPIVAVVPATASRLTGGSGALAQQLVVQA